MKKLTTIIIICRSWFDKINGNSYFTANIYTDHPKYSKIELPFQYGYGNHYETEAGKKLHELKLIQLEQYNFGSFQSLYTYCQNNNITYKYEKIEVTRKKDL